MNKQLFCILLLTSQINSINALSFKDYYLGNHEAVDAQLAKHSLNLSNKSITDLTGFDAEHVPQLRELQELYLQDNKIKTIPDSFKELKKVQKLDLSNNQITEVPAWIDELSELKSINLGDNEISTLPSTISKLGQLDNLWAYNNPLPGTTAKQKDLLGLAAHVKFYFKTPKEEQAEQQLITAIQNNDIATVQKLLDSLKTMRTVLLKKKDISKIRDDSGSGLKSLAGSVAIDKAIEESMHKPMAS